MAYLRGILEIVKAAGYEGLVIVIDEAETILRMRSDVRGKSLNGIRQIIDAADRYQGLFWVFTGTPDFFDIRRGVAGLAAAARPHPVPEAGRPRQPAATAARAEAVRRATPEGVALSLRELYPADDSARRTKKITPELHRPPGRRR